MLKSTSNNAWKVITLGLAMAMAMAPPACLAEDAPAESWLQLEPGNRENRRELDELQRRQYSTDMRPSERIRQQNEDAAQRSELLRLQERQRQRQMIRQQQNRVREPSPGAVDPQVQRLRNTQQQRHLIRQYGIQQNLRDGSR